jgi:alpha-mannosidase
LLTHFPPNNTYTAMASVSDVWTSMVNNAQKDLSNSSLVLYGFGDGGGGPTAEMIERLHRINSVAGLPQIKHQSPVNFFKELERVGGLPQWCGEMYLEFHRGTLTSQANTKRNNRKCEQLLRVSEFVATMRRLFDFVEYPQKEIDACWKDLLTMQFHDILPGSSIEVVYKDADVTFKSILEGCKGIVEASGSNAALFNPTSVHRLDVIDGKVYESKSFSYSVSVFSEVVTITKNAAEYTINTQQIECRFSSEGRLTNLHCKSTNKEALSGPLRFMLYEDMPLVWDAWDVEIYTKEKGRELLPRIVSYSKSENKAILILELEISSKSKAIVNVVTDSVHHFVNYTLDIDWDETHKLLCVEVPVNVNCEFASFECPFGIVRRPTVQNTTWEMAKFETCGHRFADLSEPGHGVALLNESKYGYSVIGNVMSMSLLRAPKRPDSNCDIGKHQFSFAIYPHDGDMTKVIGQAISYNCPLVSLPRYVDPDDRLFSIDTSCLILETVKMKHDSTRSIIVRMYESIGSRGVTALYVHPVFKINYAYKCSDYLENSNTQLVSCQVDESGNFLISYSPFEVVTLQLDF